MTSKTYVFGADPFNSQLVHNINDKSVVERTIYFNITYYFSTRSNMVLFCYHYNSYNYKQLPFTHGLYQQPKWRNW